MKSAPLICSTCVVPSAAGTPGGIGPDHRVVNPTHVGYRLGARGRFPRLYLEGEKTMVNWGTPRPGFWTGARPLLAFSLGASMIAALGGCSPGRSVESFCGTYWKEKQAFEDKYSKASDDIQAAGEDDPLLGLLGGASMMAQSIGDTVVLFEKLDKVAPEDIEPDVAAVRDNIKSQLDAASGAASDPLGALVGSLFMGLTAGGSWQRVSDYVVTNCGEKGSVS